MDLPQPNYKTPEKPTGKYTVLSISLIPKSLYLYSTVSKAARRVSAASRRLRARFSLALSFSALKKKARVPPVQPVYCPAGQANTAKRAEPTITGQHTLYSKDSMNLLP
jgi:hypothetical protein